MISKPILLFKELLQKKQFHWLVFALTLVAFVYNSLQYRFLDDDMYFLEITSNRSIMQSFSFLYDNLNGRWFSNLLASIIFSVLGDNPKNYLPLHLLQFFLFILSVSYFFKSIFSYFLNIERSFVNFLSYGAFFTSIFYWFFFDARIEVWYWETSCLVHLIALIMIFTIYAVAYDKSVTRFFKYILLVVLCIAMGNGSETFSVACVLLSAYLAILNRDKKAVFYTHLIIAFFVGVSLLSNVLAFSTSYRKNNLPDSTVWNGIKFGVYTIYLQLQKVKHIPFKIAALALLVGLSGIIKNDFKLESAIISKMPITTKLVIALIVLECLFMPAYSISQETPDRALSFLYILFLLLGLNYSIKKMLNKTQLNN